MSSRKSSARKKKLTLSVDENVVERAKDLGLNLSDVTEKILQGFVFVPTSDDKEALYSGYEKLFRSMLPLLKEYGASVLVAHESFMDAKDGVVKAVDDIYLRGDGTFYSELLETRASELRKQDNYDLLSPREILSGFIESLAVAKSMRKEQLAELEMAQKIVSAIDTTVRRPRSGG